METIQPRPLLTPAAPVVEAPKDLAIDPTVALSSAQQAAKALLTVVSQKRPVVINGKRYLTFEDWQTIGHFYGVTVGVAMTTKEADGYAARAVVYNRQGQIISAAEALCTHEERTWQHREAYALKSMAQTRACAKALRNVLAWVAVLAGFEGTPAEETESIAEGAGADGHGRAPDLPPAEERTPSPAPTCPVHHKRMLYRTGRYGDFWSCPTRKPDGRWCDVTYEVTPQRNGQSNAA